MRLTKRRSKLKKLEEEHAYPDKKVAQLTKDRPRTGVWKAKTCLRLKRTKLMIKDAT